MGFHDLWRTAISTWLAARVQVYKLLQWLDHANVSTTDNVYAHMCAADHDTDAARLVAYTEVLVGAPQP